jgi:hypothetical protein
MVTFVVKITILAGLSISASALAGNGCVELDGTDLHAKLKYLQRDREGLNPLCVERAMYGISLSASPGNFDQYAEAVNVFVEYLDYKLPDEGSKYLRAVSSNRDPYPASSALFNIGKPATPYLLAAIASGATSDLGRRNALLTLSAIHRENLPDLVRILKRASSASQDWNSSQRLLEAAKLTSVCKGTIEAACRDALYEPDAK